MLSYSLQCLFQHVCVATATRFECSFIFFATAVACSALSHIANIVEPLPERYISCSRREVKDAISVSSFGSTAHAARNRSFCCLIDSTVSIVSNALYTSTVEQPYSGIAKTRYCRSWSNGSTTVLFVRCPPESRLHVLPPGEWRSWRSAGLGDR